MFVEMVRPSAQAGLSASRAGKSCRALPNLSPFVRCRTEKKENQLEKYVFETYALLSGTKKLNNGLEIVESGITWW